MGTQEDEEYLAWVAGCQQRLLRSAYLLTGDLQRAEDLVQEALVKVALRWSRLRGGNPTAYARTIIAHDHVSWWSWNRRETLAVPAEAVTTPDSADERLVVLRALGRLTRAQRAVLVLRHFDDLTERETAEVVEPARRRQGGADRRPPGRHIFEHTFDSTACSTPPPPRRPAWG